MTSRIVLIENDPPIAALVEEILLDLGHQVDVRQRLADGTIDHDAQLVITDLVGLSTFDLRTARAWIARVRAAYPRAAIILSTAHDTAAAAALGADAVVIKPFDIETLAQTVESLLGT